MRSTVRRIGLALGLAGLLALLTMGAVLAQGSSQLGGKLLTGSDITIPAGETVDHNVYVFSRSLTSNGTIQGDLVVAAGNVDVNGPVQGDILVAGGRVSITGPVSGDVRAVGGQVTIVGDIAEDVLAAGGQVTLNGRIGQDLIVSSGELTLTGSVAGSATGNAGAYVKTGTIGGTDSITLTSTRQAPLAPPPSNPILDAIRQFIAVLLVAVLALWLMPRAFGATETYVRQRPLPSIGWGFVAVVGYVAFVIVAVVVMILLAIVFGVLGFGALVGIDVFGGLVVISGITLAFIVAAAFLADAIVGLAVARVVATQAGWSAGLSGGSAMLVRDRWGDLGLLALGVAVVVILTSLPIVGPLAKLVVVLLGLGALVLVWRQLRPTAPAVPGAEPISAPPPTPAAG